MNFMELEALRKVVKQLIRDVELSNLEHKHRIALDLSRALDSMGADRRRLVHEMTKRTAGGQNSGKGAIAHE